MGTFGEPTWIVAGHHIRSKLNATGTDLPKNTVVILDAVQDQITLPSASTDSVYGVTMEIIKDGERGAVQLRGSTICLADGPLPTPGILVTMDAAGRVTTCAPAGGTNAAVVGSLCDTALVLDEPVMVELSGPGIFLQG